MIGDEKELFYLCLFTNISIGQVSFNVIVPDQFTDIYKNTVEILKNAKNGKKGQEIKKDNSENVIKENTPEVSPKAVKKVLAEQHSF